MKILPLNNLSSAEQRTLLSRTTDTYGDVQDTVRSIVEAVASGGDAALREYTERFDGVRLNELFVTQEEIQAASGKVSEELRDTISIARKNIEAFHHAQVPKSYEIETMPGVVCRREWRPVNRVGLYIPGGSAPLLSTLLMLGI